MPLPLTVHNHNRVSLITFISVFADPRVRIGLLQPHVDVVDVRHGQVEGGSGRALRDYGEDEDEHPINRR